MTRFTRAALAATLSLAALFAAPCRARADAPARYVRLAIIDKSGSMAGERIALVKEELLAMAGQLPPSPSFPIVLIPFNHSVEKVLRFTNPAEFEKYVRTELVAGGGTSIANGLRQACHELARFRDTRQVVVCIYTDGEDSDTAAIAAEEKRLDAVFNERDRRG